MVFSVLLLFITFPDVIFSNATLVSSAGYFAGLYGSPTSALYPERPGRALHHGLYDSGGALWQSDPMRRYMYHVLSGRESPYWNPYSAAGALGPETLVDQKFSPITVVAGSLGGTQRTADTSLLLFFGLSIYALYLTVALALGLSEGAAAMAGLVFLLNGFCVSNLGSNIVHAYILFPILLWSLISLVRRPSALSFALAVLGNVLILATTFLPVSAMTVFAVYILSGAFAIAAARVPGARWEGQALRLIALQAASLPVALLVLAPLYFPIVESELLVDSVGAYAKTFFFYPANFRNLIGIISPKHFWESYNAIDNRLFVGDAHIVAIGNYAFHLGIVPFVIAALAIPGKWSRASWVYLAAAVLFLVSVGRIYGVWPISDLVSHVYGLRNIGLQYFWTPVAIVWPLLVAYGFDAVAEQKTRILSLGAVYGFIVTAFVIAYFVYGFQAGQYLIQIWYLIFAVVVALVAAYLILRARRSAMRSAPIRWWQAALFALVFVELTFYMNHLRPTRNDDILVPSAMLTFLRGHIGTGRLANFGFSGIPPEYGSALRIPEVGTMTMSILPWYKQLFEQAFVLGPGREWETFATLSVPGKPLDLDDKILDLMAVNYLYVPASWKGHRDLLLHRCDLDRESSPRRRLNTALRMIGRCFLSGATPKLQEGRHPPDQGRQCYPVVYQDGFGAIHENRQACPRVYAVGRLVAFKGVPSHMGEKPCDVAFVEDPALLDEALKLGVASGRDGGQPPGARGHVQITKLRGAQVRFQVSLDAPAIVVVADTWHPNWRTIVNGKGVYTGRVNGAFRGIALPAGEHKVEMRYRPRSLDAAIAVSAGVLLLLSFFIYRQRVRAPLQSDAGKRLVSAGVP